MRYTAQAMCICAWPDVLGWESNENSSYFYWTV